MSTYIQEIYDNSIYKVKYIAGEKASGSAKPSYHACGRLFFMYFVKGGGNIVIDSTKYEISDGDIFIMKPTEFFKHNIDDRCYHERIVLLVDSQMLKTLPGDHSSVLSPFFKRKSGAGNRIPVHIVNKYNLGKLFFELLEYLKKDSETERLLAFSRVLEIAAIISKIITKELPCKEVNIIKASRANDILTYLDSNFAKDISIKDIANHFNLEKSYLSRLFKEQIGTSMWDYVIMRRIHLFNYLMQDADSAEEVAFKVGFRNYSNFYRLYKKYMYMTPSEFKKSLYNANNE